MTLTREQILASRRDRKPVRLEVPEWGGDVLIRVLSAEEQIELTDGVPEKEVPALVLVHCLVDEDGARLFADEDVTEIKREAFPVFYRVFAEVAKLNGLSTKELEEAVAGFTNAPDEQRSSD